MRFASLAVVSVTLIAFASMVRADDPAKNNSSSPLLEMLLKQFDKNGNGALDDEEKLAAREALAKHLTPDARPNKKMQEEMQKRSGFGGQFGDKIPEVALKRFDKDGDGKLNDEERAAAKEAMSKLGGITNGGVGRESLIKRFDKDGDGKLNDEEQTAAKAEFEKHRGELNLVSGEGKPKELKLDNESLLKKFDKDGDGKLSDEEKAAARDALQNRHK